MTVRVDTVSEMSAAVETPLPISGVALKPSSAALLTESTAASVPAVTGFAMTGFAECKTTCLANPTQRSIMTNSLQDDISSDSCEERRKDDCFTFPKPVTSKHGLSYGKPPTSDARRVIPRLSTSISLDKGFPGLEVNVKSKTWGVTLGLEPVGDVFTVAEDLDVDGNTYDLSITPVLEEPQEKILRTMSTRPAVDLVSVPLWGFTCIKGRREEMEDAVAVVPCFQRLPGKMLTANNGLNDVVGSLAQNLHFYGVYDGHGGAQVSNYCRDHLHHVLVSEIDTVKSDFRKGNKSDWQEELEKGLSRCFLKVDGAVGEVKRGDTGGENNPGADLEPIAPETVGSTAVVAIVCSTHIIVANTGDSRAVLCRGKQPMPLSVDHKPEREDELERIEAAGGKVFKWNGYRVLGVLAMSRSIGDRYLKPSVIPDPEVRFVPRSKDDDCLILASDGLWDVLTNEEACDAARRRILLWHKKNAGNISQEERGKGADPAAQAAAEYLTKLALQNGSKDNISVVVVDLKPHRKLKTKS
ncbi:hypothetical protein Droror1_Dr00005957 [Drosera rotundifolia]